LGLRSSTGRFSGLSGDGSTGRSGLGNAWVYGNARVSGDAQVFGNGRVYGNAQVYGDAWVYGNAWVYGDAQVYGNARVYGDARVYGNAQVYGDAWVSRSPIVLTGFKHTLTITDHHVRAGCEQHSPSVWIDRGRAIIRADGNSLGDAESWYGIIVSLIKAHGCTDA
jgi:hypothetical protein